MKKFQLTSLALLFLIPIISIGQIPKDHFLDADSSAPKGMKLNPFIQKEKGIYHYAVLTELPFENNCEGIIEEREKIKCSEKKLRKLIFEKLENNINFRGSVYVYLTVNKDSEIRDINVRSYPKSEDVDQKIKEGTENIKVKVGKYNGKEVISRLWTSFSFPSSSKESFQESLTKMENDTNPQFENYERLVFDATEFIFSGPIYPNGSEFKAAAKIVSSWMNEDIGMGIPTFGDFHTSLTNKNSQQFFYIVAMINYGLNQKINHNRILECKPKDGEKYSEQEDVKEVQLGGAKILLEFIGNEKNNVRMTSKTKKFYKAYEKGKLEEKLFE